VTVERVILLSTEAGVGGIERSTRTLARAAAERVGNERVGFVTVWRETHQLPWPVLYSGASRGGRKVGIGDKLRFTINALKHARRWRDGLVIVACHPHLGPVARLMRTLTSRPYAVWGHGEEVWGTLRRNVKRSLQCADVVFAPSEFTARRIEVTAELPPGSVVVISHSLTPELNRLLEIARDPTPGQILTVARLVSHHSYKGVDRVIEAWPMLLERVSDAKLIVGGDGDDRPRLEKLARDLGVEDNIVFVGAVNDVDLLELYSTSAVFVLASRTAFEPVPQGEGFGLVFLEAGAAGLPVVAGNGGPAPEIVVDGHTGLLVDPQKPAEIADALVTLLIDPSSAEAMGQAGRQRVWTEYSFPTFSGRVAAMLDILGARKPTRR
jgi:phosphatidyl-myo-inositol dimannoside synthase